MFKCATCDNECPREMMVAVEELDGDNLIVLEICPMCAALERGDFQEDEGRQTVIVTREMARDAQCPEMEGHEILR